MVMNHLAYRDLQQSLRNAHVLVATFRNLARVQIRAFSFQTRSIQHIEFRDVSLHPGQEEVAKPLYITEQ
jgi:hypothetical protein